MPKNYFDLTGKQALITGANSGLGLGFAHALAKGGADVMIWGRNPQKTEAAVAAVKKHGTKVYSRIVDVSKEKEVVDGMAAAVKEMGRLDCVIANAGGVTLSPFHQMPSEQYHELVNTAQHGAFYTLREASAHMVKRAEAGNPGGSLIICGSLSIFAGGENMAHYGTAKGAVNSMSKGIAVDMAKYGVRVNVVAIGMTMTEMVQANIEHAKPVIELSESRIPMRRIGTTEDMDGIIMYLASDMSRYHTGDTITIDGGHMASIY
jgi:NAD(P)-dependent dehydrogenase (short-subunit alcohol dehydrogenase family)